MMQENKLNKLKNPRKNLKIQGKVIQSIREHKHKQILQKKKYYIELLCVL